MQSQLRFVIVEDVQSDAELIAWNLTKAGLNHSIHRVQTEPEFRSALREVEPDLILSDFSLPQFDGMRALAIAVEVAPETPFIFVSGTIGEERAINALKRGATDYVLKTNLPRLAAAVERALREKALKIAQQQFEQQLRNSEQQLRDIVDTSQDWVWETDAKGLFKFSSGAVETILGHKPSDMIGTNFRQYLHEEERGTSALLLPPPGHSHLTGAVGRWRSTDGQLRWLERNAVAILDSSQRPIGYRGTDRDITARREQESRLRRLTRSYRMLSSTSSAILRLHDRNDLMEEVCRIAVNQGGYDRVVISLLDPGEKTLRPRAWAGTDTESLQTIDRASANSELEPATIGEQAVRSGEPSIYNDLTGQQRSLSYHKQLIDHAYRAVAALPLLVDGTTVGAITLYSIQRAVFDEAELGVLLELTANLGFALQYLEKDEAVHFLSYFDSLTGLAKRSLFCQRLGHALEDEAQEGKGHLVVVFDVQKLGAINDTYGRYVGDRLIEKISAQLKQTYPDPECLGYFGSGTFAVTLSSVGNSSDTGVLLQNAIAHLFVDPFIVDGQELRPAFRSGVAFYPHDANSADDLVQNAEAALKVAREDNEKYMLYALVTRRPTTRGLALETRLAGALDRGEFLLHYQPKVNVFDQRVEGFEALLRWQDTEDGMIPPGVFIPLLEHSGAIVEVGEWVLTQAVSDIQRWHAAGYSEVRVAVNVSPLQLRRRDFVERVLASIDPSPNHPACVDIEITESMLMQDIELSMSKLAQLREAGIGVAIDDFGTGYSSLRLLAKLPVNTLKIDRSFTQSATDSPEVMTLVSTIVSLARAFKMQTVAEGVETAEQLEMLRLISCDQAQGFFFSRPAPAADVPTIITRLTPDAFRGAWRHELMG